MFFFSFVVRVFCLVAVTNTSMVRRPLLTAVSKRGSMVSRPGKPGGGEADAFSSLVCGAANITKKKSGWGMSVWFRNRYLV